MNDPLFRTSHAPTAPDGVIENNSVLRMLENSLSDGVLYNFRDPDTGRGDVDSMLMVLKAFWQAVVDTWPETWGISPRKSRLVHGVGGHVVDGDSLDQVAGGPGADTAKPMTSFRPRRTSLRDWRLLNTSAANRYMGFRW